MLNNATLKRRLRITGYSIVGLMVFAVLALSVVQLWVIYTNNDISAYGSIQANAQGLPPTDDRGAFLMLNDKHDPKYPGTLVKLLELSDANVVQPSEGAHVKPSDLKAIYVQSAVISQPQDYNIFRDESNIPEPVKPTRLPGGHGMTFEPVTGTWPPGSYVVDVPAEGMFGGRVYFQFFIDPQ